MKWIFYPEWRKCLWLEIAQRSRKMGYAKLKPCGEESYQAALAQCLANRRPYIARPWPEMGARVGLSKARHLTFQLFPAVPNQQGKQDFVKYIKKYTRPRGLQFGRLAGPGRSGAQGPTVIFN